MILESNSSHLINLFVAASKGGGNSARMKLAGTWLLPAL